MKNTISPLKNFLRSLSGGISFILSIIRLTNSNKARLAKYQKELLVAQHACQVAKNLEQIDSKIENANIELYIFQYWHQGFDAAPTLIQSCMRSVEKSSLQFKYVFLDELTLGDWIDIPQHVYERLESNTISLAGFTDVIRSALLSKYGGVWVDASCLVTDPKFFITIQNENFFAFQSGTAIFKNNPLDMGNHEFSNWFIKTRKNSPTMSLVFRGLCNQLKNLIHFRIIIIFIS